MERRTFVRGAFGLVILTAGAYLGATMAGEDGTEQGFVTPEVPSPEAAVGPVMAAGIELWTTGDGAYEGRYGDVKLFSTDQTGAQLIRHADGTLTLDELAASAQVALDEADVASFFVSLGEAGYLQNEVYVNLYEVGA